MINKQRCVVILGAGASAPPKYGIPTANQLLLKAGEGQPPSEADKMRSQHTKFDQQINRLMNILGNGTNLEDMLTAVTEAVGISKALTDLDPLVSELNKFRRMLYLLINNSISSESVSGSGPLVGLFEFCSRFGHTAWCTFNWDRVLETAFYNHTKENLHLHKNGDEGIKVKDYWDNTSDCNLLLKLHGSIYWWYKGGCLYQLGYKGWAPNDETADEAWRKFEQATTTGKFSNLIGEPAILEPSAHKYQGPVYDALKSQWDRFEKELKKANVIIIVGYSLPELDMKAKEYLESAAEFNKKARIAVFDIAKNPTVYKKYDDIFGRERVYCFPGSYGIDFDSDIKRKLEGVCPP